MDHKQLLCSGLPESHGCDSGGSVVAARPLAVHVTALHGEPCTRSMPGKQAIRQCQPGCLKQLQKSINQRLSLGQRCLT